MRQVLHLMLVLLAICPVYAQNRSRPQTCRIETKYDEIADKTTVQCIDLIRWGEAPARVTIHAVASFRGREPNESVRLWLVLSSNRSGSPREEPLLFKDAMIVRLMLDSAELDIPVTDYNTDFFELSRLRAESAHAVFCLEDLQKVLKAKSLSGSWGTVEFKLSDTALASLKDFIAHEALGPLAH